MSNFAVNQKTGEVVQFDGNAWTPVDKSRVARDKSGNVSVYNGQAWEAISGPKPQGTRSWGEEAKHQGGLTARYLLEGLSTPVGIVGDAANGVANLGISGVNAVAGTNIPKFQSYSQYRDKALEGVLPKPEGAGERITGEAARLLASVGPTAGVARVGEAMGTNALAPMGQNLLQQSVGAMTGGAAFGGAKEVTDNPWLQAAALLGGGVAGSTATALAENAINATGRAAPPTTQQIGDMSRAAYGEARNAGAIIGPQPMQRVNQDFTNWLANFGYDPALQPNVRVLLDRLGNAGQQNITAEGVDIIRKLAGNVARDGNNSERVIAGELIGRLDDMMEGLQPADVIQGSADDAAQAFTRARELWRTYRKSELIDNLVTKGTDQAMSTNSGGNLQNTIRQKLRSILDNPKTARLFTNEEQTAIRQIVRGTPTQNTLRLLGRMAPSSNAWLGILSTFAAPGVGVAVPVVGSAAKAGATALTDRAVQNLSEMVRASAVPPGQMPVQPQIFPELAPLLMRGATALNPPVEIFPGLRSGPALVPASERQDRGPRRRP